jgi:hypothetical protein
VMPFGFRFGLRNKFSCSEISINRSFTWCFYVGKRPIYRPFQA